MESSKKSKIILNVAETTHEDIGTSRVRIDSKSMFELGLSDGEYVLIQGNNKVLARVYRVESQDENLGIIRMDSSLRNNAKASLGDEVQVEKVEVIEAKRVEIAPTQEVRFSGDPTEIFKNKLLAKPILKGNVVNFNIMGSTLHYIVTKTTPKGYVRVTANTELKVSEKVTNPKDIKVPSITYDEIGGLKEEVSAIREMIEIPMKHPEVFERIGISPPKGVLLHGPPGTGKTLLAKALANELDAHFITINGPEIMSKFYGESEKQLREIFEDAEKQAPSIIFLDEIDSIAPNRNETQGEAERRVVAQLLTLMDGLKGRGNVVVIAATNRPNSIDPALRRPGRFDREIPINPPSREGRKEILEVHTRGMPLSEDVNLDIIANQTHGFTGADLEVLTKEAAMKALKKYIPDLVKFEGTVPTNVLETIKVTQQHFEEALHHVEPSAMREVLIQKPNVKWSDIGGLEEAKQALYEEVEMPLKEPESFKEAGIKAPKGVLLTGPPGTGKTLLAKAVATECEANFISVKGPELVSKWVGESEKAIREMFKKAKQVAPCVIFFDEFDSIASVRGTSSNNVNDKIVNQLLTELDGVEELSGVSIIAATNRVDLIDEALKRPGRLDNIIEIGLPDEKTREAIFNIHTKNMPLTKNVDITKLAKEVGAVSGAVIEGVCQKAGLLALRRKKQEKKEKVEIRKEDFEMAISSVVKGKKE
ncbi:MAG: CDC48 family AAA ATPase [Nanoarchaeota archaeon]|nr:CDC48 family AAA ATPase [Nanoarchaeota archaeon]